MLQCGVFVIWLKSSWTIWIDDGNGIREMNASCMCSMWVALIWNGIFIWKSFEKKLMMHLHWALQLCVPTSWKTAFITHSKHAPFTSIHSHYDGDPQIAHIDAYCVCIERRIDSSPVLTAHNRLSPSFLLFSQQFQLFFFAYKFKAEFARIKYMDDFAAKYT